MPNLTISDFLRAQERPIKEIIEDIRKLETELGLLIHLNSQVDGTRLPMPALVTCEEKLKAARVCLQLELQQRLRPTFEKESGDDT